VSLFCVQYPSFFLWGGFSRKRAFKRAFFFPARNGVVEIDGSTPVGRRETEEVVEGEKGDVTGRSFV